MRALPPQTMLPEQSREGTIAWRRNSAEVLESPSCSTPSESARRKVCPAAGFKREHVNSDNCSEDAEERLACFPASASVNPGISEMAAGEDDAALLQGLA